MSLSWPEWPVLSCRSNASPVDCLVRVFACCGLSIIFDVLQCSDAISTIASIIFIGRAFGAIDKLLFAQANADWLLPNLHLIWLVGCSGCEGPAAPALPLILDCGDDVFGSPIDLSCKPCIHWLNFSVCNVVVLLLSQVNCNKLLGCQISKLVNSHLIGLLCIRVVSIDLFDVLCEHLCPISCDVGILGFSLSKAMEEWTIGIEFRIRGRWRRVVI